MKLRIHFIDEKLSLDYSKKVIDESIKGIYFNVHEQNQLCKTLDYLKSLKFPIAVIRAYLKKECDGYSEIYKNGKTRKAQENEFNDCKLRVIVF